MSRTRTLTNLLADIRYQADVEGMTTRHTDAALTRLINQSIQEFRQLVSDSGDSYYLTASAITLQAGQSSASTLVQDAVHLYYLEVQVNGQFLTLARGSIDQRNDFGSSRGVPQLWWNQNDTSIGFAPTADQNYSALLWYLPTGTDLVAGSDTLDGFGGWEDFVVYDVACRVVIRDDWPERYQMLVAERERVRQHVMKQAARRNRGGPVRRSDARARRIIGGHRGWRQ